MTKNIFFVTSFGSIYRRVLPLIDTKKDEDNLIITSNDNIYKFFTNYTKFNITKIKLNPNLLTKETWYKAPINAIKSKFVYHKHFSQIRNSNIYFFGTGNALVIFSFIQKLAKYNQIFFYSSAINKLENQIKPTLIENWKTKIICFFIKLLLGIDVKIRQDCGLYNFCIYKKFFNKNKVKVTYQEFDSSIYKKYIKDLPILKDKEILVLISDLVGEGRVEEEVFRKFSNKLAYILNEHYKDKYVIKPHPNMSIVYGKLIFAPTIDSYIPAQFLTHHTWKVIIADCSAALVFPEEQNLNGIKLIELIDMLEFKDISAQNEMRDFLQKWNPKLLFPQSFNELERMIE